MEQKINFKDRETVYSTDADKFHKTGEPISVHPVQAEALVEAGKATREAPEGDAEAEKTTTKKKKTA